jgi:phospholipid/cholesterol/gamma-HCH transport system substrate-binding protein
MTGRYAALRGRRSRIALAAVLLALVAGGAMVVWPTAAEKTVTANFSSAIGLYPGDDVNVAGVPVGIITAIRPGPTHTTVTMRVRGEVKLPTDVAAVVVAPNLVSARFVEFAPLYTGGPTLPNDATIADDHTAVPVEWDEVKDELTSLTAQLGPKDGSLQGPLTRFVNQAADAFDGSGQSFRQAIRELSLTAGRLSDSRTDLFGTVKNLRTLVDALANSNEEIVQFSSHIASVSQVLADSSTDLDASLGALNQALGDVRGLLKDTNDALVGQVDRLTDFTTLLTQHSEDIEQVLHVAPNGIANFYNIYNPAQGSVGAIVNLPNFSNPVQFICAGALETGDTPDYYTRAELCRQRMAPVLKRLAVNFPPFLFHPISSITAYKGQIIYDTPETQAKAQAPLSELQWPPLAEVGSPTIAPDSTLSSLMLPAADAPASAPQVTGAPAVPDPAPPITPDPSGTGSPPTGGGG